MSDNDLVRVPFEDNGGDKATLLLAAAESKDNDFSAADVRTDSNGTGFSFLVPKALAKAAGVEGEDYEPYDPSNPAAQQTEETAQAEAEAAALVPDNATGPDAELASQPAAKKAPAKKTAAKKSTAKKSAAKKSAAKKS